MHYRRCNDPPLTLLTESRMFGAQNCKTEHVEGNVLHRFAIETSNVFGLGLDALSDLGEFGYERLLIEVRDRARVGTKGVGFAEHHRAVEDESNAGLATVGPPH